jgi:hypothetical protein
MISTLTDMVTGLTIHKISGEIRLKKLLSSMRLLQDSATINVLWDLREVYNIRDATAESMEAFSEHITELPVLTSGKTAFVFASETDYGKGRMFETFLKMKEPPFEIAMFQSMQEARDWLEQSD